MLHLCKTCPFFLLRNRTCAKLVAAAWNIELVIYFNINNIYLVSNVFNVSNVHVHVFVYVSVFLSVFVFVFVFVYANMY